MANIVPPLAVWQHEFGYGCGTCCRGRVGDTTLLDMRYTIAALSAAKAAQEHIRGTSFVYHPEEAAVDIDARLHLPELIMLIETMVDEAKRDLATNPDWTGPTVRINRSRLKELSNILRELKG